MSGGPHIYSGSSSDFSLEVARSNFAPLITKWGKYGRIHRIDTADTPWDMWNGEGLYTGFPIDGNGDPVAETLEISSDSINDTAAGTGARTVTISGLLDVNLLPVPAVTVTLNGVGWVSLGAALYARGSRMEVITSGTSDSNEGVLTLRQTTTTTNIFAAMPEVYGRTSILAWTVPAGYTLYINFCDVGMARLSGAAGSAEVSLRVRKQGQSFVAVRDPEITESSKYRFQNGIQIQIQEKSDVTWRVDAISDNGTAVAGEMSGYLIAAIDPPMKAV